MHTNATQVKDVLARLREGRQALLFSATLPRSLADFASAGLAQPQLVRLDAERRLSPDLGLAFFTGACACHVVWCGGWLQPQLVRLDATWGLLFPQVREGGCHLHLVQV